jgi:hypothetical protein
MRQDLIDQLNTPGDIQATYKQGDVIEVGFNIQANHGGSYQWRLCADGSDNEACFKRTPLQFEDGSSWKTIQDGDVRFRVRLPDDVSCDRCTLSARWDAGVAENQVWTYCSDIKIEALVKATPSPPPPQTGTDTGSSSTPSEIEIDLHESAKNNGDKVTMSSSPVGSDKMKFEVKVNRLGWIGFGISEGTTGLMTAGGAGADAVICSDGNVKRYWLTKMSLPDPTDDLEDASCSQTNGYTTMTFTRSIAASNANQRALTPGTAQPVVVAYGDGTPAYHSGKKGSKVVMLGSGDGSGDSLVSGTYARDVTLTLALIVSFMLFAF